MPTSNQFRLATVIARWSEERVLVETADGNTVSVDVNADMNDRIDVGVDLCIELGVDGTVASWCLAGER